MLARPTVRALIAIALAIFACPGGAVEIDSGTGETASFALPAANWVVRP